MKVLLISGSARVSSSNVSLLNFIQKIKASHQFKRADYLSQLPLFNANIESKKNSQLDQWRQEAIWAEAIIIATPEYIYNIPALLKNALEWLTKNGEFYKKPVLPIVYTPAPKRGQKAMESLLNSLEALDTKVLASLLLHHTDVSFDENGALKNKDGLELLSSAIELLD